MSGRARARARARASAEGPPGRTGGSPAAGAGAGEQQGKSSDENRAGDSRSVFDNLQSADNTPARPVGVSPEAAAVGSPSVAGAPLRSGDTGGGGGGIESQSGTGRPFSGDASDRRGTPRTTAESSGGTVR